jgi:hypothetical protein
MTEPSAGAVGPRDDAGPPTPSTGAASAARGDAGRHGQPTATRPGDPHADESGTDDSGTDDSGTDDSGTDDVARFAQLQGRPVPEHVGVFEAEHTRLQAELDTIDRL